jgi:GNAT superfamily N-acetyltransferase
MGIEITRIDTATAPEPLLRELAEYYVVVEAEDRPGDPPTPYEMQLADWRNLLPHLPVTRWLLREDGEIVAAAVAVIETEQNLDNGFGRMHVHPDKRGRGFARQIATPMFDYLEGLGRVRFDTWVKKDEPVEDLLAALGLKAVYGEKRSRLRIADLDIDLMAHWITRAQERASDYELRYYKSPLPEDVVDDFCALTHIMNTAPREDYEVDDEVLTPQMWRDMENSVIESRCQLHNVIAVHEPSGEFAGYTQIKTQDLEPDLAWQWDTGVHPDHRNKGLGRWMKADLIRRIVTEFPQVTRVDTFNAGSNEPMLNINVEMGFAPFHFSKTWQGDLATVRERFRA